MSVGAIGADILGGGGIHPPPWYTSLKHVMALGVKTPQQSVCFTLSYNLVFRGGGGGDPDVRIRGLKWQ